MKNEEIILEFRKVVETGVCSNNELKDILKSHNCMHLIAYDDFSPKERLVDYAYSVAVRERFKNTQVIFDSMKSIPYAVIKGAVLSDQIYHSPFVRHSGDIDMIIDRQNLNTVKNILLTNGFVQGRIQGQEIVPFSRRELVFHLTKSHQTAPFVKETKNNICPYINLDLNTCIYWGEYDGICDMNIVLEHTQETNLLNSTFKKLTPEMEFISLCLHHYKDMNSIYLLAMGNLKLSLFCDIYFYIRNVHMNINKLYDLVCKLNANPYVFYCLYYTDLIFDVNPIKKMMRMFESPFAHTLISSFGLSDDERCTWNFPFLDRLFSPSFSKDFYFSLDSVGQRKIQTNYQYMQGLSFIG